MNNINGAQNDQASGAAVDKKSSFDSKSPKRDKFIKSYFNENELLEVKNYCEEIGVKPGAFLRQLVLNKVRN